MNSAITSQWPSTGRLLRHTLTMGLLATVGFGLGRIFFSATNAASLALAALAMVGYVLIRFILRIKRAESQLSELRAQMVQDSRQAEALASLAAMIHPVRPLPPTRGWAMSPDILCQIVRLVLDGKPKFVLEASSGVSTIVIAYCLKQLGWGNVIALEHDQQFAAVTKQQICEHGLEQFARVIDAPLVTHQVNGQTMQWYDLSELKGLDQIELLVIDGPPATTDCQQDARFPALPLLYQKLTPGCPIVLDDADREEERRIVRSWLELFPDLSCQHFPCEKGASILTKATSLNGHPEAN